LTSDELKIEAMCWLRYGKRMPVVTTEVGRWSADILGLCDTMSVEVEVKVSKSDIQHEFSGKQTKHWLYANAKDQDDSVPNYFYMIVPQELGGYASDLLKEKAPKSGVAIYTGQVLLAGRNIEVVRRATKLRDGKPSPRMLQVALARMSSELCGSKQIIWQLKNKLISQFDDMAHAAILIAAGAVGSLDCEDKEIDLDQRAAQLAMCVESKLWSEVSDPDKWRAAAKKWLEVQGLRNRDWLNTALQDKKVGT